MGNLKLKRIIRIKRYRKLTVFLCLIAALWLGYTMASYYQDQLIHTIDAQALTIVNLNQDNHNLVQQLNRDHAQLLVCESQQQLHADELTKKSNQLLACNQDVSLFQHVMAPELSGDLLSVEFVSLILKSKETRLYELEIVLLQPRLQKMVISGDLNISAKYENSEELVELDAVPYRFKFFQQPTISFELPDERVPVKLSFSSQVMQYKRVKDTLNIEIDWPL
ncbi:hypothetical protein J3L16_01400 [Alteromonas sp. 5E99-2]|uniref:DUF6776 family protein n=1 Tax=Alteromonas sp. 5E99-2 TaxID=2817683 RepID=UPI001A98DDE5|nr:DUF6776 family protein [Alteromonas sp. 5E99-2]MBO1254335.1 hypothetical protein [Alteromonas sp. 5E99-2]